MSAAASRKPVVNDPDGLMVVVAPASAPSAEQLSNGVDRIRKEGFRVESLVAEHVHGYLAGSDDQRAGLLNAALRRDDVLAIMCARGGFGTTRILHAVDFDSLRRYPKLIVGYSDITALQLGALSVAGVPSLSASMAAVDWPSIDDRQAGMISSVIRGTCSEGLFSTDGVALTGLQDGSAQGPMIGGNLTLVCRLIGSPYLPDMRDAILFLEEVGEAPYRIDGLFSQLHLSGVLGQIGGLVLGAFTDSTPPPDQPSLEVDEVLAHYAKLCRGPVAAGLPYGHVNHKLPIPTGANAEFVVSGSSANLRVTEQVVNRA